MMSHDKISASGLFDTVSGVNGGEMELVWAGSKQCEILNKKRGAEWGYRLTELSVF